MALYQIRGRKSVNINTSLHKQFVMYQNLYEFIYLQQTEIVPVAHGQLLWVCFSFKEIAV